MPSTTRFYRKIKCVNCDNFVVIGYYCLSCYQKNMKVVI